MSGTEVTWDTPGQQQAPQVKWDDEAKPSMLETGERLGKQFLGHMETAADSLYPVRIAKGVYGRITNQPGSKEVMGNIATDAIRDFAVAGAAGPESAPEKQASLAVERGPRYQWGKTIPDESGASPLPEKPPAEVLRARGLGTVGQQEPIPSAGLGRIPIAEPKPTDLRPLNVRRPGEIAPEMPRPRAFFGGIAPEPIPAREGLMLKGETEPGIPSPRALSKQLDSSLSEAVGNKPPIRPGVKIRDQLKPDVAGDLPEGHTPVISSAIKSYKYDPAARELHVTTNNGTTYVSGEVTPEQAETFRTADSKGLAWKAIRDNSPLVAKINGAGRISVRPTEFRSVGPESAEEPGPKIAKPNGTKPSEDLTPKLKESLAEVKARGKRAVPVH